MEAFRDCPSWCKLVDLGFVKQKYTWCNGRFEEHRTKLRLDRIVANEEWMVRFLDARVFHSSMSVSNLCLLKLNLSKRQNRRPIKKRFLFEAMWTRDARCREVVELAWDPGRGGLNFQLADKLRSCKEKLQRWNWKEFGNVKHTIKQKREQLQQLESLNSLHKKA